MQQLLPNWLYYSVALVVRKCWGSPKAVRHITGERVAVISASRLVRGSVRSVLRRTGPSCKQERITTGQIGREIAPGSDQIACDTAI